MNLGGITENNKTAEDKATGPDTFGIDRNCVPKTMLELGLGTELPGELGNCYRKFQYQLEIQFT